LCRNVDDDDDDLAPPWNLVNAAASGITYQRLEILWGCWFVLSGSEAERKLD